jgi:hypothetical protein
MVSRQFPSGPCSDTHEEVPPDDFGAPVSPSAILRAAAEKDLKPGNRAARRTCVEECLSMVETGRFAAESGGFGGTELAVAVTSVRLGSVQLQEQRRTYSSRDARFVDGGGGEVGC